LNEILAEVDDEPRLMDTNLEATHDRVGEIRRDVKSMGFSSGGPLYRPEFGNYQNAFEDARSDEYNAYERYAADLEGYREGTKELDTVQRRRQAYITALQGFQGAFSDLLRAWLRARPPDRP
jgi:hypothetical protein